MGTLTTPHWDKISDFLRDVMIEIGRHSFSERFYLAGGTALALHIGHRQSIDLDFFSFTDELLDASRREIVESLKSRFLCEEISSELGTLQLSIEGRYVGFYSYGFSLIANPYSVENVALAGLADIGLMKLDAIMGRGARKDFYDLYFITQTHPLEKLFELAKTKYPHTRDYGMMVLPALADFDHADQDTAIQTQPPVDWDYIKEFFVTEVRRIGLKWFEEKQ